MISSISSNLVSISEENLDERLTSILKSLGRQYHADHAGLILFYGREHGVAESLEWCPEHENCSLGLMKDYPEDDYSWFLDQLYRNELVYIKDSEELPAEADILKIKLLDNSLKSLLAVPVSSKGKLQGIMVLNFKSFSSIKLDSDTEVQMRIPANLIADALMKIDSQKRINYLAYFDPLTALPNRALFYDRLENAVSLANREGKLVAVMMMDLDAFKNVNDSMGHDAGDLLLRKVAERLTERIREYDTMSRFGGDEFMFIISQLNGPDEAMGIAGKLLTALAEPIKITDEEFYITASIGITICPDDASEPEMLIKNADLAMYASKKHGKNRYSFYSSKMKENTHEKMRLTNELYRALERNEFILHYQPQVELENGEINGMEALIRWNHPEKGLISPVVFIPLAEEVGLISAIGRWVLFTACSDNKKLQEDGFPPLRVAVNLSVKQFGNADLAETVRETLRQTRLAPQYLELEITESIANGENSSILDTLNELRDIGVTISIDDFGTEYSSLSRLNKMPIDRIKIDKQFVDGISKNKGDESITKFIVELSKNLGIKVIAEGVETDEQLAFLSEKSCDEIQGYYFYKPMSFRDLSDTLVSEASK